MKNDEDWSLAVVDPLYFRVINTTSTVKMKLKLENNSKLLPTMENHAFVLVESCGEILMARMMMGNRVRGLICDIFQADLTKME